MSGHGSSVLSSQATGTSSGYRPDLGRRALRRLLLAFLLSFLFLCVLYTSRERLATYATLVNDVPVELDLQEPNIEPHIFIEPVKVEKHPKLAPLDAITAETCSSRRAEYRNLVDSRRQANTLKVDKLGRFMGKEYLFTETQSVFSDVCWTSDDRYNHYTEEVDPAYLACNALDVPNNRTAVILRLEPNHLFTHDAEMNLRALILEVGWYYGLDVLLLQNIEHGEYDENKVPREFRKSLINFKNDDVFDGYPEKTKAKSMIDRQNLNYHGGGEFGRYTTTYYQFVQAYFFNLHQDYSFSFFLDSHVRSLGNYKELFGAAIGSMDNIDLLSFDPILPAKPTIEWSEADSAQPETFFRGRFIVHGISKKLAGLMESALKAGRNAAHDAFLPAIAIKNNLKIAMFAHPLLKLHNTLQYPAYTIPDGRTWPILNLNGLQSGNRTAWQYGGSFAADTVKWVDDLPQTKWIDNLYQDWRDDKKQCLPGLLIYPVSGR